MCVYETEGNRERETARGEGLEEVESGALVAGYSRIRPPPPNLCIMDFPLENLKSCSLHPSALPQPFTLCSTTCYCRVRCTVNIYCLASEGVSLEILIATRQKKEMSARVMYLCCQMHIKVSYLVLISLPQKCQDLSSEFVSYCDKKNIEILMRTN